MTASRDDASADRWLALLSGANTWDDPERRPNITVRSAGGIQVLALGASLAVLLWAHGLGFGGRTSGQVGWEGGRVGRALLQYGLPVP